MKSLRMALLSLIGLCACSEQHPAESVAAKEALPVSPRTEAEVPIDTAVSVRIGNYWVTPDSLFKFNALEKAGNDSLFIVTCQKNILDPFGPIANRAQLKSSLLKDFSVKEKSVKQENGVFPVLILTKGPNRLVLYFDQAPDASASSYVFKGEIRDSSVTFANNIRVGMPIDMFYRQFFTVFPLELQRKYKVVVFNYCVDGIRHLYEVRNGHINAVKFSTPGSFWKVDY